MSTLSLLNQLLADVFPANRFYAEKLQSGSSCLSFSSFEEFKKRVPFTTKEELVIEQKKHPPYGRNHSVAIEKFSRFNQTSGTTGYPLFFLDTDQSWQWMLENWKEVYQAAGVGSKDRIYFAFSFGPFLGFWTAFEAASQMGALCLPGGALSSKARLEMMRTHSATVLCCTPTYALRLAEVAHEMGWDLGQWNIQKIIVAGEPGGSIPEVCDKIESAWKLREKKEAFLFDHYGMTEVGPVAYGESGKSRGEGENKNLVVMPDRYYAEIVDPKSGEAVKEGEPGELILTPLGRSASPLLRYRTGDLVKGYQKKVDKDKEGGEVLFLEGGIIGRIDDMVVVRGVNIYPSAVECVIRRYPEIKEYRVLIEEKKHLAELTVEVEIDEKEEVEKVRIKLEEEMKKIFSLRIPVKKKDMGTLPRFEMKAKRWIKQ